MPLISLLSVAFVRVDMSNQEEMSDAMKAAGKILLTTSAPDPRTTPTPTTPSTEETEEGTEEGTEEETEEACANEEKEQPPPPRPSSSQEAVSMAEVLLTIENVSAFRMQGAESARELLVEGPLSLLMVPSDPTPVVFLSIAPGFACPLAGQHVPSLRVRDRYYVFPMPGFFYGIAFPVSTPLLLLAQFEALLADYTCFRIRDPPLPPTPAPVPSRSPRPDGSSVGHFESALDNALGGVPPDAPDKGKEDESSSSSSSSAAATASAGKEWWEPQEEQVVDPEVREYEEWVADPRILAQPDAASRGLTLGAGLVAAIGIAGGAHTLTYIKPEPIWVRGIRATAGGIDASTALVGKGLTTSAAAIGGSIRAGGESLKSVLSPGMVEVSPRIAQNVKMVRMASGAAVAVSNVLVKGVAAMARSIGTSTVEAIAETSVGKKIGEGAANPTVDALRDVGFSTLKGVDTLFSSLEQAGRTLLSDVSTTTSGVVGHKFGPQVGAITEDTLGAVGNVAGSVVAYQKVGYKTVVTLAGKETVATALATEKNKDRLGGEDDPIDPMLLSLGMFPALAAAASSSSGSSSSSSSKSSTADSSSSTAITKST